MEPKGGDKPSNRRSSRGVSCCRKQSSRQYERALPLAIPEIRPWGGVSKYKESAYGDVSSALYLLLCSVPTACMSFAVLQGAQLTVLLDNSISKSAYSAAVHNTDDFVGGRHLADTSF